LYIKEINISQYRNLKNIRLGPFSRPDKSELIVLAGPNGTGKTSILEALTLALSPLTGRYFTLKRNTDNYQSFQIQLGLSANDISLIEEYVRNKKSSNYDNDTITRIKEKPFLNLNHNFDDTEQNMHLKIKELIRDVLNENVLTPGIYFRAERTYNQIDFDHHNLVDYDENLNKKHFNDAAFTNPESQFQTICNYLLSQTYFDRLKMGILADKRKSEQEPVPLIRTLEPYDKLIGSLFPGYKLEKSGETLPPSRVFIRLQSNKIIDLTDLSSGELEIFFILSFFHRFDISNKIILIDEPELHLHPELARRFINIMINLKPGNQIWIATHNSEIIDEAGTDKTILFSLDERTREIKINLASDAETHIQALRRLISYSGYIGITKNFVFIEGQEGSVDRKLFSSFFPQYTNQIKLIPICSGREVLRINSTIMELIKNNIGWLRYYLIRDRDFLTDDIIKDFQQKASGKLYFLNRCQIENYLLDYEIISDVLYSIFNIKRSPQEVQLKLESIAKRISAEILVKMIDFRLNHIFHIQDISLGKMMTNQSIFDNSGEVNDTQKELLLTLVTEKLNQTNKNLGKFTTAENIESEILCCLDKIKNCFNASSSNDWVSIFPGKRLLELYAKEEQIDKTSFINSIIKSISTNEDKIASELKCIMSTIVKGDKFPDTFPP
jgi:predicted ATP-dependent endonuclease of OLD family